MVSVTGYAFPWDFVDDPDAVTRARALGVDAVALAASYHAARVVNMFHPTRRVTEIPFSAFYGPRRDEAWRGHRLTPRRPTWLDRDDAFATSLGLLAREGLDVDAWIVLTHVDDPENADLEVVERNAYDETYPYALCPSSEDVREYCVTLVEETLRSASVRGVVLEAAGPMGFDHAGAHDKSEFAALSVAQRQLLSICFCAACRRGQRAYGLDPDEVARKVRLGVDGDASAPEAALGTELAGQVAAFRLSIGAALRGAIIERVQAVQPQSRITVHASARRWATGSFPALGASPWSGSVGAVVANAWETISADEDIRGLSGVVNGRANLGEYVRLDRGWDGGGDDETLRRYARAGVSELHLYHLGLFTKESAASAASVVESFRCTAPLKIARET